MTLAQGVAKARNLDLEKVRISGRDGIIGERSKDEIAVMSLRGGDIVGRHTVGFYEEGEFLELNHTATSRATFAKGAIKIAIWLNAQKPKMYSINDFLEFKMCAVVGVINSKMQVLMLTMLFLPCNTEDKKQAGLV